MNELGLLDLPNVLVEGADGLVCAVCFRPATNRHHVVLKGAGGVSTEMDSRIPLVSLCGMGNASGCHGLAHQRRLHFDWRDGGWFYLETARPVKRETALEMPGWTMLGGWVLTERRWFR